MAKSPPAVDQNIATPIDAWKRPALIASVAGADHEQEPQAATAKAKADATRATAAAKAQAEAKAEAKAEADAAAQEADAAAQPADVYYANCSAVRAAGADPIYAGQPGYSRKLDRDGDGIACE